MNLILRKKKEPWINVSLDFILAQYDFFAVGVTAQHCLQGERNDWNSFWPNQEVSALCFLFP